MNVFETKEGVLLALDSIRANKFRSFLTILGVMIGVSSVIAMVALIQGLNSAVASDIESMGSNVIYIMKFPPEMNNNEMSEELRQRKPITMLEVDAVREMCPSVDGVSPQNYYFRPGGNVVKYKNKSSDRTSIFGTSEDFEIVNNRFVDRGRFFNDSEDKNRSMVCVIGSDLADALFENTDPLGKSILMNNTRLRVIGVLEKQDRTFGGGQNNMIALPYGTFEKLYPWEKELFLAVKAHDAGAIEKAQDEIRQALRRVRGVKYNEEDNFAMFTQESATQMYEEATGIIWFIMIGISSIGLMVGGIGVLNIMLVSVTERTREIGVRKAIGARRANVFFQFLVEAMTLSGSGGVIGIVFGLLLALLISAVSPLPMVVPFLWILFSFCLSVGVGLVAGVAPAYRAASVDPIVSLRYE
ncbi:MAG: ABC transporter permease [Candidatus Zixiibacteriota bacterium]